jgi:hypothetical protein
MIAGQGNNQTGKALAGMHHEDEALPKFVVGRSQLSKQIKAIEALPGPVTQKMETPVLYFYADKPLQVNVDVTFTNGIISQWYPDAVSFLPAIGQLTKFAGGNMHWQVQLAPGDKESPIAVEPTDIWAPSRKVASVPVRAKGAIEQFIFYRGLGDFSVPLEYSIGKDSVSVSNPSKERVSAAFYLNVHDGAGLIRPLGAIEPGHSVLAEPGNLQGVALDTYLAQAKAALQSALVDSGLYADESQAMVDTWAKSYFLSPGERVLYVLPRAWTDTLLPLQIDPKPDALVRTLVGRVELLTQNAENALMTQLKQAFSNKQPLAAAALGRFAEPQLQRALQLNPEPAFQTWVKQEIERLNPPEAVQ